MPESSLAQLYGKGVFTTVAISDGKPLIWEKHWRRLTDSALKLGIDISSWNEASLMHEVLEHLESAGVINGRVRITFLDRSSSEIWGGNGETSASLSIIVGERRNVPENFKLTTSPHLINTTSPLAGIKTCNYLEHLLSYQEANERGFDEAIRINERGEITSACMANLFWVKDSKLFTPSLRTGCLAGTTREFVLENLDCEEVEATLDAIEKVDVIFLTSAGLGIVQACELDGRSFSTSDHPILNLFPPKK